MCFSSAALGKVVALPMELSLHPGPARPQPPGSGVSPHLFRRTVAAAIHANGTLELAAEMLGHTDARITLQHYV